MKKFSVLILTIFIVILSTFESSGENPIKLFYGGSTYILTQPIITDNGDYYINAQELAPLLGMKYILSNSTKSVSIEFNNIITNFRVYDDNTSTLGGTIGSGMFPKIKNGKLYFPFRFLEYFYDMCIKYNSDKSIIYILPGESIDVSKLSSFTNLFYNYSLYIGESIIVDMGKSDYSYTGDTLTIRNKDNLYNAVINCEKFDEISFKAMRDYFGDYTSSDEEIFEKISSYKYSYFKAMQDYYKSRYLYGSNDENFSEANIKVIKEYDEVLFGQKSHIILYNTIESDMYSSTETIHINISVPVYSNKTIYTIDFTVSKGKLNQNTLKLINELICSINIFGASNHSQPLALTVDFPALNAANDGIYPELTEGKITYSVLKNEDEGYELSYPSTFLPYRQNSIIDGFDYRSFKIDYNNYFSIAVEPSFDNPNAVEDKINYIWELYKDKMTVSDLKKLNINGIEYSYIEYKLVNGSDTTYVRDYFALVNANLYNFRLNSRFNEPSDQIKNEFAKILESVKFTKPKSRMPGNLSSMIKFTDESKTYSFYIPNNWYLNKKKIGNTDYEEFNIKSPEFSGPIDIRISEGKLKYELSPAQAAKLVSDTDASQLGNNFESYTPPYLNCVTVPLLSGFHTENGITYVHKLINYIDSSSRKRLCYSVDIIDRKSIYSLFISISDYALENGEISNTYLNTIINSISSAFGLKGINEPDETGPYDKYTQVIEDYIKQKFGEASTISSIDFLSTEKLDALAVVEGIYESGFYRIQASPDGNGLLITDRLIKKDVLRNSMVELINRYKSEPIYEINTYEENMTLELWYMKGTKTVSTTYSIDIVAEQETLDWKLVRTGNNSSVEEIIETYLENYVSNHVDVFYPKIDYMKEYELNSVIGLNYRTYVYADFGSSSGYFILEIDPVNNSVSTIQFTPAEYLLDIVKNFYANHSSLYNVINCRIDDSDKFMVNVFLIENYSNAFCTETVNISFNLNTLELLLEK